MRPYKPQNPVSILRNILVYSFYFFLSGDKDDDDDDDADDKIQSSVMTRGEEGRQESQEQSEVDHGDFEMVVRRKKREGNTVHGVCLTLLGFIKSIWSMPQQTQFKNL